MSVTRKVGEELVIGEDVTVTVVEIGTGRVRLAVDAPLSIRVDRREVRDSKLAARAEVRG